MILILGAALLVAAAVAAQPAPDPVWPGGGPGGPGAGPCWRGGPGTGMQLMFDRLDLSDEQRQQIEALVEEGRKQRLAYQKDLLRLRHDLQGEMLKDAPDAGKVRKLAARIGELRTQMQTSWLEQRLAVRKLLTPEQRDQLILMRAHGGRGGRCGMGPGGMGPGAGPRGMGHGAGHRGMGPGGGPCGAGPQGAGPRHPMWW